MRDQQFPKYILVGIGNAGAVLWRIQRTSDMAICGIDNSYRTMDGCEVRREPTVREWGSSELASAYMTRLEDGTAGSDRIGDYPVAWVPDVPFFTESPPMHVDGPL